VESFRTFHGKRRKNSILMRQHVIVVDQPAGGRWEPPPDEPEGDEA